MDVFVVWEQSGGDIVQTRMSIYSVREAGPHQFQSNMDARKCLTRS